MASDRPRWMDRRNVLTALGATGAMALAGCVGDEDEPADDEGEEATDDDGEEMMDDEGDADDTELLSTDPAPEGEPLTEEEIQALIEAYDDQPFNDAQLEQEGEIRAHTPSHVWKWVSDETFIGLHFNAENPEDADMLNWIVIGQKGLFTEESQPSEEFTHFHQAVAEGWDDGHGGEEGDEGYWLTHIAVRDFEAPAWEVETGVDYEFMPTEPPEGSEGHDTGWETPHGDEGGLSTEDRDELLEIFDFEWTNEDQQEQEGHTPRHVWLDVTEDVYVFLHWDEPNPAEAEELWYYGIAKRGQFRSDDIPAGQDDDFTHFHLWEADSWEAGHGGQEPDQYGTWLVHHAVRDDFQKPFHDEDVEVGVDQEFMPTEPDE